MCTKNFPSLRLSLGTALSSHSHTTPEHFLDGPRMRLREARADVCVTPEQLMKCGIGINTSCTFLGDILTSRP